MPNVEFRMASMLTCYNRCERTLQCLDLLFAAAAKAPQVKLTVFLLDDASPDGTGKAVSQWHPQVRVIRGTGDLFWNRGMHQLMKIAMQEEFDYYLWLNDDTMLAESALSALLNTSIGKRDQSGKDAIIVGTTEADFGSGVATYGGRVRRNRWRPLQFELVTPGTEPTQCDTMNGNCVLVPAAVARTIGALDPVFRHAMGDTDYGFRARQAGFDIWVAPGFVGTCKKNRPEGEWVDTNVRLFHRLRKVVEPKALPLRPWAVYTRRHAGMLWPLVWMWPYVNIVRTSITAAFQKRQTVRLMSGLALASVIVWQPYPSKAHASDPFVPQPIDRDFFGMHIHWNDTSRQVAMPPIGSLRLWDTRTTWSNLEPRRDLWDFAKLDKHVALAGQHNLDLVLTLGATPRWASTRPNQDGPYGPGTGEPPRDYGDWDNYVRQVATRYKGKIRYYEVVNEPVLLEHEKTCHSRRHFWCGSAAELVEFTRRTSEVVKSIDPGAKIVAPGFTGANAARLDLFLDAGGGQYVDVIAHHFYALNPQEMLLRINLVKQTMLEHGYGHLELWNTESGYTKGGRDAMDGIAGVSKLDDASMKAYVPQSLALAASAGVRRYFWYAWDNGSMGMASPDGSRALPGGLAYIQTVKWLLGRTIKDCAKLQPSFWSCIVDNNGKEARMVWSTAGVKPLRLEFNWNVVARHSLDGSVAPVSASDVVNVGPTPVLFVPAGYTQ